MPESAWLLTGQQVAGIVAAEAAWLRPEAPTLHRTRHARIRRCMLAGLNALVAAQAFGATKIVITDVREDNLPLAQRLGAKFPLLTPPGMTNEEAAGLITKLLPPDGPDCVIDCAGYQSTILVRKLPCPGKLVHVCAATVMQTHVLVRTNYMMEGMRPVCLIALGYRSELLITVMSCHIDPTSHTLQMRCAAANTYGKRQLALSWGIF